MKTLFPAELTPTDASTHDWFKETYRSPPMSVTYTVDERRELVVTTARGIVTFSELMDHIAAKERAGLAAKAELFDARDVALDLSKDQLNQLAERSRSASGPQ